MAGQARRAAAARESKAFEEALQHLARRTNHVVVAPPGYGKTYLLRAYADRYAKHHPKLLFIEGRRLNAKSNLESLVGSELLEASFDPNDRPLILIDGLDEAHPSSPAAAQIGNELRRGVAQFIVSTRPLSHQLLRAAHVSYDYDVLELQPWTHQDIDVYLRKQGHAIPSSEIERLRNLSAGIPAFVSAVASELQSRGSSAGDLDLMFAEFGSSGILTPNGQPVTSATQAHPDFVGDIETTNWDIIRRLKRNPEEFRNLSPRKFEEVVADILQRLGYSVELTPASKDGGFDIYVAKKDPLGSFLFLVECKRYAPPNKVGVHLVRSLYGVVQKSRANAGMLVTTSYFTKGAQDCANELAYTLQLHDFLALKRWLKLL